MNDNRLLVWTPIPKSEGGGLKIKGTEAWVRQQGTRWAWHASGCLGLAASLAEAMLAAQGVVQKERASAPLGDA